jgi:membrane-associated phospholipid phosphatase
VTEGRLRRVGILWALCLCLVLLSLGTAVNARTLQFSDHLLLLVAQAAASHPLDLLMALVGEAGSVEVTGLVVLGMVLSTRSAAPLGLERWVPLAILVAATLVEVAAKSLVHQPSPPLDLLRGPHLPGLGLATPYSFPSGHMTRATLMLGIVSLRLARRTQRVTWLWVCVGAVWTVAYSLVYLGYHWPADVAGGILLGGLGLALCLALAPRGSVGDMSKLRQRGRSGRESLDG